MQALLQVLQEECNEVGQMASKAVRFGLDEVWEDERNPERLTNKGRLHIEINDIYATVELLQEALLENLGAETDSLIKSKKSKIKRYMEYSRKLGQVE